MRYYLIDKVTELVLETRTRGFKNVTLSDEFLQDHYADDPIMPGALILEAAAQLGGFLLFMSFNKPNENPSFPMLVQVRRANFYKPCRPGDRVEIVATLSSRQDSFVQIPVDVEVEGKRVARAELTFSMGDVVHSARSLELRRSFYKILTRDLPSPCVIP